MVRSDACRTLTLIHIERKIRANRAMMANISAGINRARIQLNHFDHLHETCSPTWPGLSGYGQHHEDPHRSPVICGLQNTICTNKIRTALLAGLRSASCGDRSEAAAGTWSSPAVPCWPGPTGC